MGKLGQAKDLRILDWAGATRSRGGSPGSICIYMCVYIYIYIYIYSYYYHYYIQLYA